MYSCYEGCPGLPLWDVSLDQLLSGPRDTPAKSHPLLLSIFLSGPPSISHLHHILAALSCFEKQTDTCNVEFFPQSINNVLAVSMTIELHAQLGDIQAMQ